MPNIPLTIPPGINRTNTQHAVDGSWYDADKVRFRLGHPEPIGGWQQRALQAPIEGVVRRLRTWRSVTGDVYTAAASNTRLYIIQGQRISDITPYRAISPELTNALATTTGSTTLTITDATDTAIIGETIVLSGFAAGGGLTVDQINTRHTIATIISTDVFTVELPTPAGATDAAFGGTVGRVNYEIIAGAVDTLFALGFGVSTYGTSTWSTPREADNVVIRTRVWSLDTWGEILVGTFEGAESPFMWSPSDQGLNERAVIIPNAPPADLLFVSTPDRHLVLLSTVQALQTVKDPLAVRWSDQNNLTVWAPTATNTAGDFRLPTGNRIEAAINGQSENLVWTDTALFAMRFQGPPFTFGFNLRDDNTAIAGRNAAVNVAGRAFWISSNNFYVYDGVVRPLACPVLEYYASDVSELQSAKFFTGLNREFNEIWWFYASRDNIEVDRYIIYDYLSETWSIGTLDRTSWAPDGILANPQATSPESLLFDHETGLNADTVALEPFIESGELEIGNGDALSRVQRIIPDFTLTGTVDIILGTRRYPGGPLTSHGPYSVMPDTTKIDTRVRGRSVTFRVQSSTLGTQWALGLTRLELNVDGRR